MTTPPAWLPRIFNMDGIWERNLGHLYSIFENDFINNPLLLDSKPVWFDRRVIEGKYPEGFWHIITKYDGEERIPDFRRAERLPWCGPSIRNSNDPVITKWDIIERDEINTYIWLESFDYLIVLVRRSHRIGDVMVLRTAYYVEGDSTRNKLKRKYANRIT